MRSVAFFEGPYGVRFWVRIDADEVLDELTRLEERLGDLRPVFRIAANVMRKSFAQNFFEGGRPEKWKPLAESTIAQKNGEDPKAGNPNVVYSTAMGRQRVRRLSQLQGGKPTRSTANILIAGGQLRDSYVQKGANHIERVSKDRMEIGSKHFLAHIHEDGTPPYVIRPVRAKALSFLTGGGRAFAKSVNHPGLPARPVAIVQPEDKTAIEEALLAWVEGR